MADEAARAKVNLGTAAAVALAAMQMLTAGRCAVVQSEAGALSIHVGACEGQLERLAGDIAKRE
jgi:hypothetical protein